MTLAWTRIERALEAARVMNVTDQPRLDISV